MSSQLRSDERARRIAFIKAHHPDRGGDPAYFVEGLAALDGNAPASTTSPVRVSVHHRRGPVQQIIEALLRRLRPQAHPPRVR
ncbi:hypothetical protein EK0264_05865 [Epidermidibacterium keratini]|uniref:Uncharacterized protein n=1 Tax=Epidermidibacterium keratini TaxID=1891644 RepID=A0A7L4YKR5_9ACTN|nr:hypothetical protein [Epidermidibacterium keratini]QHB99854.1 hypothetical protein EK0264_05865 [Epidermidibacterium keratini]